MLKAGAIAVALLAAVQAALGLPVAVAAAERDFEYQLKAEFVERFTRFVDWPESASGERDEGPFVIGVMGDSPIAAQLAQIVAQRKIKGREGRLLQVTDLEQVTQCDLLFIAASAADQLAAILSRTENQAILTVADSEGFGGRGVLINLYREGEYLRFEINRSAVEKSGLRFSSNLLRLARLVE